MFLLFFFFFVGAGDFFTPSHAPGAEDYGFPPSSLNGYTGWWTYVRHAEPDRAQSRPENLTGIDRGRPCQRRHAEPSVTAGICAM